MPERPAIPTQNDRRPSQNGDGTRELLRWGGTMLGAGIASWVLLQTLLGGFSPTGASTNSGWFALIVALMCIPFGGLLLALGVAKWMRNRAINKSGNRKNSNRSR